MEKLIQIRCNEKKEKDIVTIENGIYNGFGKMVDLPPTLTIKISLIGFDTKELGDAFIELGKKIKEETNNIDIKSVITKVVEIPNDIGKQFTLSLVYETKEGE